MPIAMPKTLDVPSIERIRDIDDVKRFLREFTEILTMGYEHSEADIQVLDAGSIAYLGDSQTDGSWRFTIVGGTLEVQKRISGTWTRIGVWSE